MNHSRNIIYIKSLSDSRSAKLNTDPFYNNMVIGLPGNTGFDTFGTLPDYGIVNICLTGKPVKINNPAVIINCMADADHLKSGLETLSKSIEKIKEASPDIRIINHPERVLKTSRDNISRMFQGLKGLIIPKVIKINPLSIKDFVKQITNSGLRLPVLIREAGLHGGKGLVILEDITQERQIEQLDKFSIDGRHFYITEFVDFKSTDGLYRKARLVFIHGNLYVRHLIISDNWNIHSRDRKGLMAENEKLILEEQAFLQNGKKNFSKDALSSLNKIQKDLGLDVLGIDIGLMPDGKILIFEINAAMEFIGKIEGLPDYLKQQINVIKNSFLEGLHNDSRETLSYCNTL